MSARKTLAGGDGGGGAGKKTRGRVIVDEPHAQVKPFASATHNTMAIADQPASVAPRRRLRTPPPSLVGDTLRAW